MVDNELLIKINADAKNATKAFDDIKGQTEDLEGQLNQIAKISAVGFAALTAELGLAIHAYAEAEAANRSLVQSLQTQGIVTEQVTVQTEDGRTQVLSITEAYKLYAQQIEAVTGLDDDALVKAQSLAQGYLGQTQVTKELTQAIADLSTKYGGDLNAAAEAIGRTIGTQTNAFARQGLVLSDTATKAERMAAVLEFVNGRFKGAAEAANQGLGSITGLKTAFGNLQEAIGERFAKPATALIKFFTDLFNFASKNKFITDVAAGLLAAGVAVTSLGVALPILAQAFLTVRAAMLAFGVASNFALAGIPALIGLITGAIAFVAVNWGNNLNLMRAALDGFVAFAKEAIAGFALVLIGAFDLDINKIKDGLSKITGAYKVAAKEAAAALPEETKKATVEQDKVLEEAAQRRFAKEQQEAARRRDLRNAENELTKLQLTNASEAAIELKKKEIEVLKQLQTEQNADTLELLKQRHEQILELEDEQRAQDLERAQAFREEDAAVAAELRQLEIDEKAALREQDRAELQAQALTDLEIQRKIAKDILTERIKNRNLELEDRKRYGVAIATINAALRSDEINAAKTISGELVALANSKNAELKAIGKAAAIAQITIGAAESAVTIAQKVIEVLPFPINIPIAAALSAARLAYGAEQIGRVNAAQTGGVVEGGVVGKDSVPFLLEPGELVVPRKNFDEVVSAVAQDRGTTGATEGGQGTTNQYVFNGDFMADTAFLDRFIERFNERIEFGNARILAQGVR